MSDNILTDDVIILADDVIRDLEQLIASIEARTLAATNRLAELRRDQMKLEALFQRHRRTFTPTTEGIDNANG